MRNADEPQPRRFQTANERESTRMEESRQFARTLVVRIPVQKDFLTRRHGAHREPRSRSDLRTEA